MARLIIILLCIVAIEAHASQTFMYLNPHVKSIRRTGVACKKPLPAELTETRALRGSLAPLVKPTEVLTREELMSLDLNDPRVRGLSHQDRQEMTAWHIEAAAARRIDRIMRHIQYRALMRQLDEEFGFK